MSQGIEKYEVSRGGIKTIYDSDRILYSVQFNAHVFRLKCRKQYFIFVIIQFILAWVSISLSLAQMECSRNSANTEKHATVQLLIILNISSSALNFIIIIIRYNVKFTLFRVRASYRITFIHFLTLKNKLVFFFLELAFNWVLPYVTDPSISNWLIILMMFKLYPIVLLNNCLSSISKNRQCISQNLESFKLASPVFGGSFNLRYQFRDHGALWMGIAYIIVVLFFSYLFFISNRPQQNVDPDSTRDYQYLTTIYWAFITTTTVGYGDISPYGQFQRALAIILVVSGVILTSLIMGFVTTSMQLNDNEMQALRIAERKQLVEELDTQAAKVIQYSFRIKKFQGCEPVTSALLKNPRFMELQRHLLDDLANVQRIRHILAHDYNFDPSAKSNDEPTKLIERAKVLNDYHLMLNKQIDFLNDELSNLLRRFNVEPVLF